MEDSVVQRQSDRARNNPLVKIHQRFIDARSMHLENPVQNKKPHSCDLLISEKCNLRCVKCQFWKSDVDG